jgi:hypothetical protein
MKSISRVLNLRQCKATLQATLRPEVANIYDAIERGDRIATIFGERLAGLQSFSRDRVYGRAI